MAIAPRGVHADGCPGRIEGCLLDKQHTRSIGMSPSGYLSLCHKNFTQGPAEVDRSRSSRPVREPRNRAAQSPVDLEGVRPRAEAAKTAAVARWETITSDRIELARCHVEEDGDNR